MFMKLFVPVLLAASLVTPVFSLPTPSPLEDPLPESTCGNSSIQTNVAISTAVPLDDTAKRFPDLMDLVEGNQAFLDQVKNSPNPDLLKDLTTKGQSPEYLFLGCSDSRVSESAIFAAPPGVLFTQRNIANQFQSEDNNAVSVLSYGVTALGVNHIIVMGHYGCGGVQAAMLPKHDTTGDPSRTAVQHWIDPIRQTFSSSNRSEIVSFREANEGKTTVELPKFEDPAFRALIEENVKVSVSNIVASAVMNQHWTAYLAQHKSRRAESGAPLKPVYVHGFVYDISTGHVTDLGVSAGPNGPTSEAPPQDAIKRAIDQVTHDHSHL